MLIHMDGFDVYRTGADLTFQYLIPEGAGIGTQSGRFGQGTYMQDAYNIYIQKNFDINYSDIWMGVAIYTYDQGGVTPITGGSFSSDKGVFLFQSNLGNTWEALITYNNLLGLWKFWTHTPSEGSPQYTFGGQGIFQTGTQLWHWIDVHYLASPTDGTFELWIDDVQVINLTGVPTTSWGGSNFNGIYFGAPSINLAPPALIANYDDWYVLDATTGPYNTTRLGDSRIYSQIPISDVAGHNDGTPSFGTNYFAMVDEPQNDGLTTYITINGVAGQEDIFNMSSLPSEPSNIFGNRVLNIVEQTAGGTITANAIVVSSGVQANGNTQPLLNVFFSQFGIFEQDPNTSHAWTWENINAVQCGFQVANI